MARNSVDLANVFQAVTQALAENQQALNQADEYNHNHGTNMLQTFETITNTMQQKQRGSSSVRLATAAKKVSKNQNSGSSQLYAQHLAQAANQVKGRKVDEQTALQVLQTLIGGQQPAQEASSGGMLSELLGGLTGAAPAGRGTQSGFNMENLLSAGMAFMQSRQGGGTNMQALMQAFMAGSGMGSAPHRSESTQIVVDSFLKALSGSTQR